ncbi:hypothetical protein DW203_18645 [Citrobacter portucalensis]|uniref:hypothetical protein n=1 Tax=Citrobacter TaxID=544 RepID=UPI000E510D5D|nr:MULTISPECIES: hypothetical protein [Citrobacter]MDA8514372.1 hypothetical protein [Citrobacter sp. Igbk 14]RHH45603.1 hypothetical protein DW203_18645 [Citrobacter portucalensis]
MKLKAIIAASLLVAGVAHAFELQNLPKGEPAVLTKIAEDISRQPYTSDEGGLFDFSTQEVIYMGSLGDLRQGEVTTSIKTLVRGADPYRGDYHCTYPNGGLWILYEAANPQNHQIVGENIGAGVTCISTAWISVSDSKGISESRRWDTTAAWSTHWKALNQGAVSGVKSAWDTVTRFVRNQPIIDALLVAVLAFIGYRVYRRKAGKK